MDIEYDGVDDPHPSNMTWVGVEEVVVHVTI
jgi:hypothetical protein